jgi:hypothetical protein
VLTHAAPEGSIGSGLKRGENRAKDRAKGNRTIKRPRHGNSLRPSELDDAPLAREYEALFQSLNARARKKRGPLPWPQERCRRMGIISAIKNGRVGNGPGSPGHAWHQRMMGQLGGRALSQHGRPTQLKNLEKARAVRWRKPPMPAPDDRDGGLTVRYGNEVVRPR